ncbi:hypothetical protein DM194_22800 (plasmid) [Azospirillum ramasamyi]|uniref:Uncharacterized protein n=1 Tax=Azospirillum ramasamyi TaxID=682998 RepID=A0A2U9SC52_9PROT|nr:hypothetical protein DM194_22800 [Azospirillum ramasamyi]
MTPPLAGAVPVEAPDETLGDAAGPPLPGALAKDTPGGVPPDPAPAALRAVDGPVPDAVPAVPSVEAADGSAAPLAVRAPAADFLWPSWARRSAARRYSSTTRRDGIWSWVSPVSKSRKWSTATRAPWS